MRFKDILIRAASLTAIMIFSSLQAIDVMAGAQIGDLDVSVAAPSCSTKEGSTDEGGAEDEATASTADRCGTYAVSLGADLSDDERSTVLQQLGFESEIPDQNEIVSVTNEEEHRFLDGYVDSEKIGTRSLTSVKITIEKPGHGITVKTDNIDYCTEGMYRNALMTAGVKDADVIVASPYQSSGTAGVVGAIKAYGAASGEQMSDQAIETAAAEMMTTGKIEDEQDGTQEKADAEAMFIWLKTQLSDSGVEVKDSEAINKLIDNGIERFEIKADDKDRDMISGLILKWQSLGLDSEYIRQQAEELYKNYGTDVLEKVNREIEEKVQRSAGDLVKGTLSALGRSLSEFFRSLLGQKDN